MNKLNKPSIKKTLSNLNENIIKAEHTIRSLLLTKLETYEQQLIGKPEFVTFNQVTNVLIGNPQVLDHKDILFENKIYKKDVIERAEDLIYKIGKSMGAYTLTKGIFGIRQNIAKFIKERDGESCDLEDIYLTNGTTSAIMNVFNLFAKDKNTSVLLLILQYPLYTTLLAMYNLELLPYYLNEEEGWSID